MEVNYQFRRFFFRLFFGSHDLCLVPDPLQLTRYLSLWFSILHFKIPFNSHCSLPLASTSSCCSFHSSTMKDCLCPVGKIYFHHVYLRLENSRQPHKSTLRKVLPKGLIQWIIKSQMLHQVIPFGYVCLGLFIEFHL